MAKRYAAFEELSPGMMVRPLGIATEFREVEELNEAGSGLSILVAYTDDPVYLGRYDADQMFEVDEQEAGAGDTAGPLWTEMIATDFTANPKATQGALFAEPDPAGTPDMFDQD